MQKILSPREELLCHTEEFSKGVRLPSEGAEKYLQGAIHIVYNCRGEDDHGTVGI